MRRDRCDRCWNLFDEVIGYGDEDTEWLCPNCLVIRLREDTLRIEAIITGPREGNE